VRILCLMAVSLLVVVPHSSVSAQDEKHERVLWVYEAGWFEKKDGKAWIEVNRDVYNGAGKFEFKEVKRSDKYVELYDESRKLSVRLSDAHAELKVDGDDEWNALYDGRWKERDAEARTQAARRPVPGSRIVTRPGVRADYGSDVRASSVPAARLPPTA
jgi:hypothetical protein